MISWNSFSSDMRDFLVDFCGFLSSWQFVSIFFRKRMFVVWFLIYYRMSICAPRPTWSPTFLTRLAEQLQTKLLIYLCFAQSILKVMNTMHFFAPWMSIDLCNVHINWLNDDTAVETRSIKCSWNWLNVVRGISSSLLRSIISSAFQIYICKQFQVRIN